nr:hypothetical protein I308_03005 [Cryptococcus tetragattii IND107]
MSKADSQYEIETKFDDIELENPSKITTCTTAAHLEAQTQPNRGRYQSNDKELVAPEPQPTELPLGGESDAPDGGYGWVIIMCVMAMNAGTWGTVCIVLGQCMAGICHSFGTFLVCQGIVFGIGMVFIL